MQGYITLSYFVSFACYGMGLIATFLERMRLGSFFTLMGLAVNGVALVLLWIAGGQFPVFHLFESFLLCTFILALLHFFAGDKAGDHNIAKWVLVEILILFAVLLFYPKSPAPHRYHHDALFVFFFHAFRAGALGLMLFSSAHYIQFLIDGKGSRLGHELFRKGRDFLLLGAIFFLTSEYSGIIWCLNGWGDFWRWNYGFLSSAFIMLYLMLVFHIPGKHLSAERFTSLTGALGSLVMIGIAISRSAA